jgi:hypothetical protein
MKGKDELVELEKMWKLIPSDMEVFPSLLFRPPAHPLGTGGYYELPKTIINRYPPFSDVLFKKKVKFLLMTSLDLFPPEIQKNIDDQYAKITRDYQLYVRKSSKE